MIRILTNLFLQRGAMFAQADGVTEAEHARIRAAEAQVRRRGGSREEERRVGLEALIATGKVHTIHCGPGAAEQVEAMCGRAVA